MHLLHWSEVQKAAEKAFSVWLFGGYEMEWGELAWEGLAAAGLTSYANGVEKTRVVRDQPKSDQRAHRISDHCVLTGVLFVSS